ncbi:MAG: hypothetical protein IKW01_06865 [Firmicutes bacterium]|nr:hypothetical protein [Bacillota bacterium]
MGFAYYDYYTTPIISYVNYPLILAISVIAAVVLGIVIYFAFLRKSNEGRFGGFKKTVYNLLTFNRFYAENIIKFAYVITACIATVTGIVLIVLGSFIAGIVILIVANILLRIFTELVMMFIILCRKTVSVDKRLAAIENFYSENYGDDWGAEPEAEPAADDCDFDREGCCGCDGYSACSAAADADCCGCESWDEQEDLCTCADDCDVCEKKE